MITRGISDEAPLVSVLLLNPVSGWIALHLGFLITSMWLELTVANRIWHNIRDLSFFTIWSGGGQRCSQKASLREKKLHVKAFQDDSLEEKMGNFSLVEMQQSFPLATAVSWMAAHKTFSADYCFKSRHNVCFLFFVCLFCLCIHI